MEHFLHSHAHARSVNVHRTIYCFHTAPGFAVNIKTEAPLSHGHRTFVRAGPRHPTPCSAP